MTARFALAAILLVALTACGGQSRDQMMQQAQELEQQSNFKGAIVVYKNLLEKYPGDIPASLALTSAYIETGKPDLADAEITRTLSRQPGNVAAQVLAAKAANALNKPDRALEILAPLLGAPDVPAEAFEQAGNAHLLGQRYANALQAYRQALDISENLLKARLGLAESLLQLGQPAQAREQVEAVLASAPKDRTALYMLLQMQMLAEDEEGVLATYGRIAKANPSDLKARYSEAFIRLGKKHDLEFARTTAQNILSQYPNAPEGFKLQGLLALDAKDNEKALEYFLKAQGKRRELDTSAFLAQTYLALGNLETAVSHIQDALTVKPDLAGLRRMLVSIYMRQNRLDEAVAEAQKLLEKSPGDVQGQRLLGDVLVANREYEKGLEVFSMMAENDVQMPLVHSRRGMLLAMKGDADAAEAAFRKGIELGGDQLEPRLYYSSFLVGRKRVDEAVEVLGAGPQSGQQRALALNGMGKMRLMQRRLDEAVDLLEKAKAADPKLMLTYYNLASVDAALGKPDKAIADYEAALAVEPDDTRALLGAAAGYDAKGDYPKAKGFLERAAQSDPRRGALPLASFLVRRGDNAGAMQAVDALLAKQPKDVQGLLFKSRLHAIAKEPDKTMAVLSTVETVDQRTGLLEKAKYQLSLGDKAKALEYAGRIRELRPGSGGYALPLAEMQALTGDIDAACDTLRMVLRTDPGNAQVLTALAQYEAGRGKTSEALVLVEEARKNGLDAGAGHSLAGTFLLQAGDRKAAAAEYERALSLNDRQPVALNNLAMIYADDEAAKVKALDLAARAFALESTNPAVLDTLGYVLIKNGRGKEAVAVLERADKLMPGNKNVQEHLVLARQAAAGQQQ